MTQDNDELTIQIEDVSRWNPHEDQPGHGILLHTTRGDIHTIVHNNPDPEYRTSKAIVFVWGARGGFDGPAGGIYARLAEELKYVATSIRIDYRLPNVIPECVLDTMAGLSFLNATGHSEVALVGHSFGGAVVIAAAPFSPMVKAVAALSPQTYGASNAGAVSPRPLLLAHGGADTRLPQAAPNRFTNGQTIQRSWSSSPAPNTALPSARKNSMPCSKTGLWAGSMSLARTPRRHIYRPPAQRYTLFAAASSARLPLRNMTTTHNLLKEGRING